MKHYKYLEGVNNTFKHDDKMSEIVHCILAIPEEIGEVFGWYKKHFGYKKPKSIEWKAGICGEFGDLLYYITKISEITNVNIEVFFEDNYAAKYQFPSRDLTFDEVIPLVNRMMKKALFLQEAAPYSESFKQTLPTLLEDLYVLIASENFEFEEVQKKNFAKLKIRHGDSFNDEAASESGRNREKEDEVLKNG